jgi:hypothetical protein
MTMKIDNKVKSLFLIVAALVVIEPLLSTSAVAKSCNAASAQGRGGLTCGPAPLNSNNQVTGQVTGTKPSQVGAPSIGTSNQNPATKPPVTTVPATLPKAPTEGPKPDPILAQPPTPPSRSPDMPPGTPVPVSGIVNVVAPPLTPQFVPPTPHPVPMVAPPLVPQPTPMLVPPQVPQPVPVAVPPMVPQQIPMAVPPLVPQQTPMAVPPLVPQPTPMLVPPQVPQPVPVAVPPMVPQQTPMAVPPLVPQPTPMLVPPQVPQQVPVAVPPMVPQQTPMAVPPLVPQQTPMLVPPQVPQQVPVAVPPMVPQQIPMAVPPLVPQQTPMLVPPQVPQQVPVAIPPMVPQQTPMAVPPLVPQPTPVLVPVPVKMNVPPKVTASVPSPVRTPPVNPSVGVGGTPHTEGYVTPRPKPLNAKSPSKVPPSTVPVGMSTKPVLVITSDSTTAIRNEKMITVEPGRQAANNYPTFNVDSATPNRVCVVSGMERRKTVESNGSATYQGTLPTFRMVAVEVADLPAWHPIDSGCVVSITHKR